jgi:LPS-assembly lipoprotein
MRILPLLPLLPVLLLAACGFHLRGAYTLPFDSIYVNLPEASDLRATLKRSISAGTHATVSDDAASAQATLQVVSDTQQKDILSIGSDGRVREFQLVRNFTFRVDDKAGHVLVAPSPIVLRRDVTFSDSAVLSKESEEGLLWRDIQDDLVQQILRRLAAAKVRSQVD